VLKTAQLDDLFDATVTGVDAADLHLKGKPAPDVFWKLPNVWQCSQNSLLSLKMPKPEWHPAKLVILAW